MNLNIYKILGRIVCFITDDTRFAALDRAYPRLLWSQAELHTFQEKELSNLLTWAYQTVDAYQEIFGELDLGPDKLELPEQLDLLPILKRESLQSNLDKYTSQNIPPKLRKLTMTGGTTREPVKVWWDSKGFEEATAVQYRTYDLVGAGYGTRWLKIVGGLRHIQEGQGLKSKVINLLTNRKTVLAFEFDERSIEKWIDQIISYKPDIIFGYGGHIQILGEYLKRKPQNLGVKAVLFGGESLPNYRKYEKIFHCPVVQTYATREVGVIAYECPKRNLHIAEDIVYVESVQDEKQDFPKLLITSLLNRATPLIRYEIGDYGEVLPADCPCGSSFRRLSLDIGRVPQYIELANKKTVTNLFFIHVIKDFPVAKYQFVVYGKRRIQLLILPQSTIGYDSWEEELKNRIIAQLGPEIDFQVRVSDNWIASPTGKILPVVEINQEDE